MHAAMRTQGISPTQKLVLVCLADHANGDGLAYPSAKTISGETGLKDRAVRGALDALYSKGVIRRAGEPVNGAVQRWIVSDEALTTPAANAAVLKEEPRHLMPPTPAVNADPPRQQMPGTPAANADKATNKLPVEATKKTLGAAAVAAPIAEKKSKAAKPEKTDTQKATNETIRRLRATFWEHFAPMNGMDAEWMGRNLSKVLGSYPEDDIAGTLRAIAAKYPDAKSKGQTLSFLNLSLWVEEWQDAGRPGVFPGAVFLHLPGGTNGTHQSHSRSLPTNDEFEQERLELEAKRRAATERRNCAAVG